MSIENDKASFEVKENGSGVHFQGAHFSGDNVRVDITSAHDQKFSVNYGKPLSDENHELPVAGLDIRYLDSVGQSYDTGVSGSFVVTVSGGSKLFKGVLKHVVVKGSSGTVEITGDYTFRT